MPRSKDWSYTRLTGDDAAKLLLYFPGSDRYTELKISQLTCSYATNSIPTATVALGVGRDAQKNFAPILLQGSRVKPWLKAKLVVKLVGDTYPGGPKWPEDELLLFDGYTLGSGHWQADGKISFTLQLVHRSVDLALTSCVNPLTHPGSPWQISAAAMLSAANLSGAGGVVTGNRVYPLSGLAYSKPLTNIGTDWWSAVKDMLELIASVEGNLFGAAATCGPGALGSPKKNDRALRALAKIEGGTKTTKRSFKFGKPLKPVSLLSTNLGDAMRRCVGSVTVDCLAAGTMWDKLVGELLPSFRLSFVPRAFSDLVIAQVPAFSGAWRIIGTDDHNGMQKARTQDRLLRGVGIVARADAQTMADQALTAAIGRVVQGCYLNDADDRGDGVIDFEPAPAWLEYARQGQPQFSLDRPVVPDTGPARSGAPAPRDIYTVNAQELQELAGRYAKSVYWDKVLAGCNGTVSGRLRFDIAPGSVVQFNPKAERFLGDADRLAVGHLGYVDSVSIMLNAEAGAAGTTLGLSFVRTVEESLSPGGSIDSHPLFGSESIHGDGSHGAPLLDEFKDFT